MSLTPFLGGGGGPALATQDFFSPFFRGPFDTSIAVGGRGEAWPTRSIATDVIERENEFEVKADLPGISKEDIKVTVDKDVLRINVQKEDKKEEEKEEAGVKYHRYERSSSFVGRAMRMPENANLDDIKAHFENGTLRLTFPKVERKETARKVRVE